MKQIGTGTAYGSQEYDIATIYALLGQKELAYQWLDKTPYMHWLFNFMRIDPMLDNLREEPRFLRLLAEGEEQIRRFRNKLESMIVDPSIEITLNHEFRKI